MLQSSSDEPTPELIRQLRREEIEDARRMTFAQKFWAGAELFDYACEIAESGSSKTSRSRHDGRGLSENPVPGLATALKRASNIAQFPFPTGRPQSTIRPKRRITGVLS